MKNKNGFTMVELLAVITILGILSMIAIGATTKFFTQSENKVYKSFEDTMETATQNYLLEHSDLIPNTNYSIKVDLATLIDEQYTDDIEDPEDAKKTCNGYVDVKNNGDKGLNLDLTYQACLKCSRYQSKTCK